MLIESLENLSVKIFGTSDVLVEKVKVDARTCTSEKKAKVLITITINDTTFGSSVLNFFDRYRYPREAPAHVSPSFSSQSVKLAEHAHFY